MNTPAPDADTDMSELEVRALVSNSRTLNSGMLQKDVAIGTTVTNAHLDTCATHCFLSNRASKLASEAGYTAYDSKVKYSVEQGNPLCITSRVHVLPLAMVRNDGTIAIWDAVLFVVADCGADIIIGYPTLKLGGIVDYDPPTRYAHALQAAAGSAPPIAYTESMAHQVLAQGRSHQYQKPDQLQQFEYGKPVLTSSHIMRTKAENTVVQKNDTNTKTGSKSQTQTQTKVPTQKINEKSEMSQNPTQERKGGATSLKLNEKSEMSQNSTQGRKGPTALTESEPYGKNPPLPEEVMEALNLLKNLAEQDSAHVPYTEPQLKEIQNKLSHNRPKWANCLSQQHLNEVSDKEAERFINDMMDKPKWQKSIFQTAMHLNTVSDFKEFEIPQKPGRDDWNPPQPRLYKNPVTSNIVAEWLKTLLENLKCRLSKATHPAPVTVVQKPPRDPRVCLDYRNRNNRSEIPIYPMPDVHDFLEEAVGYEHYCSFDMAKMFTQFRIKESDKHLAAFITPQGVYEPEVVMFGLAGAPQHAVREVGGGMADDPRTNGVAFTAWAIEQNKSGVVTPPYEICPITKVVKGSRLKPFIDDVFLKSMHAAGLIKMVELFFEFCLDHNLILSRKKAIIMKKRLRTLGFVVSKEGKHLDPSRIIALLEAPLPRSKETLHSMLSSYTFIRMFIPNFALIASPLYEATKGIIWKGKFSGKAQGTREVDPTFVWTDEMTRAYNQLRAALLEAPILVTPDWRFPLFLSVDASLRGEGWVLWQIIVTQDGTKVAVAILYGSKKYTDTERKWETTRQEATAIRSALQDVEEYVFGQHFYLFSDHLNLRFMHNSVNRAVLRMRDYLSQFNMTVVHCPGAWNNADAVSRLETEELPITLGQNLNSATVATLQERDLWISRGTDTSDTYLEEDCHVIHVSKAWETDSSEKANVLCSEIRLEGNHHCNVVCKDAACFLCNRDHIIESYEEDSTEDFEQVAQALNTISNVPHDETDEWFEGDRIEILQQLMRRLGCEFDKSHLQDLRNAALQWNKSPTFYTSTHDQDLIDEQDQEDLEWCEPFDRSTTTLLTQSKTTDETVKVTALLGWVGCKTPRVTQTTPADFRMAQIKVPDDADFKAVHNDISGHHGLDFSYRKLLKLCGSKWANERGEATKVKQLLKVYIDGCPTCQKLRGLREKIKCKHSFIISRPFLEVSYDFIVFKRPDKHGNQYILAAIDNFLKLVELKAVKHRDAETVAQFLLEISSRFGHCARLRSDNEASFVGLIISKLNEVRGTESSPCVPYRPEANSIIERQNAIIMFHLTALIQGCNLGPQTKIGWSELIPTVFSIVNNTPKNPLGISPLSMVYGVFANYDRPLIPPSANIPGSESNPMDYVDILMQWQNKLLDLAEEIQSNHFQKLEKRFNGANRQRQFNQGDFVLQLKNSTGISGKPSCRWIGPFLVMERRENDPTHPVLDLMNLTDMTLKEAAADDCRQFNTSWFEEDSMMHELKKIAALDLDEFVVEKILNHKPAGDSRTQPLSKYHFLVKWEDFDEPTWEPYSGVKNLEPLDDYSVANPGLKIPISK